MEKKISFTKDQLDAIEAKGRTLLVSAAAGSGKTATLTQRIIHQLRTDPEADIERMLIVTFTRAAASELKARITKVLQQELSRDPTNDHIREQLIKAGSAKICTIDSFCFDLVKTHFERLDLSPSIRIADDSETEPIRQRIMKQAIEEMYIECGQAPDEDHPFAHLENNPFKSFIDSMLNGRNDETLIPLLIKFKEHLNNYPEGISLLKKSSDQFKEDAKRDFPETLDGKLFISHFEKALDHYKSSYDRAAALLSETEYADKFHEHLSLEQALLAGMRNALTDTSMTPGSFCASMEFTFKSMPSIKGKDAFTEERTNYFKSVRESLKKDLAQWRETYAGLDADALKKDNGETSEDCLLLYRLFSKYEQALSEEYKMLGICSFQDVTGFTLKLLDLPDILEIWQNRFDSVYIDEYQDVTPVQDSIFQKLGGADKRFMVGDMKQSIYAFRGADPSLFADYRKNMVRYGTADDTDPHAPACIYLSENFRCDEPIIAFSNLICGKLFRSASEIIDYRDEDDLVASKEQEPGKALSKVTLRVFGKKHKPDASEEVSGDSEADEADDETAPPEEVSYVTGLIRELLASGRKPGDIAILSRTHTYVDNCGKELTKFGIRTVGGESAGSRQDPGLVALLNLLTVIDNPHKDDALFETLQKQPFCIGSEVLHKIHAESKNAFSLYDSLCRYLDAQPAEETDKDSETQIRSRLSEVRMQLDTYRGEASRQSADSFLTILSRDPDFYALCDCPAFFYVRDVAHRQMQNGFSSLHGFLPYLEKQIDSEKQTFTPSEDAVSLLTIHQSKGLEFPVVILIGCGQDIKDKDDVNSLVYDKESGVAFRLFDSRKTNSRMPVHRIMTRQLRYRGIIEEEMRLLYVALTRAREELYVSGKSKSYKENFLKPDPFALSDGYSLTKKASYLSWIVRILNEYDPSLTAGIYTLDSSELFEPVNAQMESETDETPDESDEREKSESFKKNEQTVRTFEKGQYPLSALHGIPTKIAASKLTPDFLDEIREDPDRSESLKEAARERLKLIQSPPKNFAEILGSAEALTAAEQGTLVHLFMQFCDYGKLVEEGVEAEIARLTSENAFLTVSQGDRLNRKFLENFRDSALLKELMQARAVFREYGFTRLTELKDYTADDAFKAQLGDHKIQVRGSLDLLYEDKNGDYHLIDYKTDHVPKEISDTDEELSAFFSTRHHEQLYLYALSVKDIFGKAPKTVSIFSFPLGRTVELPHMPK